MLDLNSLAEKKAHETTEGVDEWGKLLAKSYRALSAQSVKDEDFVRLAEGCRSQNQLALLTREFFSFTQKDSQSRSAYQFFIKEVDESEFDLAQWICALEEMYRWLDEHERKARLDEIIGYLNCCATSPVNQISQKTLAELCIDFLAEHGFEKAQ